MKKPNSESDLQTQPSYYRQGRDPEQSGSSSRSIYQVKGHRSEAASSWNLSKDQKNTNTKTIYGLYDGKAARLEQKLNLLPEVLR
ncbi:unnamed protein product [Phytophthora fragariaefolia]|uniref:Unnamed protein product n=1 Tax=Phytophthora fragariaefolia TaxID=1490495 RepID=A0A9W6XAV7_9STRA|nr:unnamed protein product [Phytophthora fragariaefolia]